ncbi:MAG TPA: serine hydrolase domain-containing protein [Acidimicrobiia bacterium]|nr:serine hydrolase domain-containing protein [Acidimicrobiia bacterium]
MSSPDRSRVVSGDVAPGWGPVADELARNFSERGDVGAACAIYSDGVKVVDVWGGVADPATQRPWAADTLVLWFSCTKGMTAVCANLLIERGVLDADAPVASYWPEFAAEGKEAIPLRWLLAHRAGLPVIEADLTLEQSLAWTPVVDALAAQRPVWEPGTRHGYHLRSFGWLVGEVIRRATGDTIGAFLRTAVADPLGLEMWIGLPAEHESRLATLVPPPPEFADLLRSLPHDLLLGRATTGPSGHFAYDDMWNRRALHACELPSSNGIGDARSLARMYAALIGDGVDGIRLLSDATVAAATEVQASGRDEVILVDTAFGLGFMLGASFNAQLHRTAFGHAGAGGSLAFADPDVGISFAYVMNDLRFEATGDPRSESLVAAAYRCTP